jgi:hypothetical protein
VYCLLCGEEYYGGVSGSGGCVLFKLKYVYCPTNVQFYSLLIVKHSATCFEPYPGSSSGTSVF